MKTALDALLQQASPSNLALLFSLRHDWPTEWAAFVNSKTKAPFSATICRGHFPYWVQRMTISIEGIELCNAQDPTKTRAVGDTGKATDGLATSAAQFPLTIGEDDTNPRVLIRAADTETFLLVHYTASQKKTA